MRPMKKEQKIKEKSKKNSKGVKTALMEEAAPFGLVEAFRNLSMNLGYALPKSKEDGARVICISSSIAGEGKSTISANLALSLANNGYKTMLVDCDMRKPQLRRVFQMDVEVGLVDYLSGNAAMEKVITKNIVNHLDCVFARRTAPNPIALIRSDRFKKMLDQFASEYDYVLIDTPPIDVVSDAVAIATQTDGIALITRQMQSNHALVRRAISEITFAGANFLGFVLNDLNLKKINGSYKKYKYKYGYKYKY